MSRTAPPPTGSPWRGWVVSLTLKFLTTYLVLCLIVFVIQRSLIYAPSRARSLTAVEAPFGRGRCHDIRCRTADGLQLNGWLVLREGQTADEPEVAKIRADGTPVILYFGGNGGHRARRALPVGTLASVGAHVVIFDHRGYGENPGQPSEKHLAADARSIWDRLTQKLGVSPQRIVIYGESLGGGVAVRLASELCRDGQPPGGLIVQSTFSSLADAGSELYWFLPVRWLLVDRYESARQIPFVSCPILQLHGRNDRIVPLRLGQRLFEAAPPESTSGQAKRQLILEHADHNDVYDVERGVVAAELSQFLKQSVPAAAAARPGN